MNTQPEALRLANALYDGTYLLSIERDATAAELRRLHESEREGWRYADELEKERKQLQAMLNAEREQSEAVMKQALQALEWSSEYLETMGEKLFHKSTKVQPGSTTWHVLKAIAALRQALEQPVAQIDTSPERVEKEAGNKHIAAPAQEPDDERIAALRTLDYCHGLKAGWNFCVANDDAGFERAIASTSEAVRILKKQPAPAQEPVAWMTHSNDPLPMFHKTRAAAVNWDLQPTPLYTTPPAPAKPWVGLTNDERKKLADVIRFNNIWYLEDMLRAAEEMLERKNT